MRASAPYRRRVYVPNTGSTTFVTYEMLRHVFDISNACFDRGFTGIRLILANTPFGSNCVRLAEKTTLQGKLATLMHHKS